MTGVAVAAEVLASIFELSVPLVVAEGSYQLSASRKIAHAIHFISWTFVSFMVVGAGCMHRHCEHLRLDQRRLRSPFTRQKTDNARYGTILDMTSNNSASFGVRAALQYDHASRYTRYY
jgi:hypothetical protein